MEVNIKFSILIVIIALTFNFSCANSANNSIKVKYGYELTTLNSRLNVTEQFLNEEDRKENEKLHQNLLNILNSVKLWREIYIKFGFFITFFGSTLNLICIFIFSKSKLFRNSSFPYYVYVISIIDTLNILMRFAVPQSFETYIRYILVKKYHIKYEVDFEKYDNYTNNISSEYHCGIFIYLYNSLTLISVWLMAAVSFERWLVIKFKLQTRFMIKLRALVILSFIFITVFSLNIFDLAPGFYIKPQWYANLTLLCERDDKMSTVNNISHVYKKLGPIKFNTEIFAFTRTIFQSVVPFLVVLIFNSLIIYNFKKIKSTALGRGKSNSCVSVMSGMSQSQSNYGTPGRHRNNFRSHRRTRHRFSNKNKEDLEETNKPNNIVLFTNCSRSPSPLNNYHNVPTTPTSLVSALNLAEGNTNQLRVSPASHTTPTIEISKNVQNGSCTGELSSSSRCLPNKQLSNSFLMPPTFLSLQQNRSEQLMSDSATISIGTTNSSANISLVTTSNLTATTLLNQQQTILNTNSGGESDNKIRSGSILSGVNSNQSDKISLMINSSVSNQKPITQIVSSNRVSFKNRMSKVKINRETDIMLIILSFIILISQLPFTIVWYLIYYRLILFKNNVYISANSPNVFYIIRMLEMIYFSLNFFFYITLSPSLRKEIKNYLSKKLIDQFLNKYTLSKKLLGQFKKGVNENDTSSVKEISNEPNCNYQSKKLRLCDSMDNHSPLSQRNALFLNSRLSVEPNSGKNLKINSKRQYSNSSGEFVDYLDKLRSISPIRRPTFFSKQELESIVKTKSTNSKNLKKHIKKNKKKKKNENILNSNIKIVIDNMYDEEEKLKTENNSFNEKLDKSELDRNSKNSNEDYNYVSKESYINKDKLDKNLNSFSNNKRIFNFSSPSFFNSFGSKENIFKNYEINEIKK